MNTKQRNSLVLVLLTSLAISSCGPAPTPEPTIAPLPTSTAEPVVSPALTVWHDVPIMPGATTGMESGGGYGFFTSASAVDITTYYQQEMAKLGWTGGSDLTGLVFTKGDKHVFIRIVPHGNEYLVAIGA